MTMDETTEGAAYGRGHDVSDTIRPEPIIDSELDSSEDVHTNGGDKPPEHMAPRELWVHASNELIDQRQRMGRFELDLAKARVEIGVGSAHGERAESAANEARTASLKTEVSVKGLIAIIMPRLDALDRKLDALIAAVSSIQKDHETP